MEVLNECDFMHFLWQDIKVMQCVCLRLEFKQVMLIYRCGIAL